MDIIPRESRVEIERAGGVVKQTAGIFTGRAEPMTAEELRNAVEQVIADDVVERVATTLDECLPLNCFLT
ncbi:MAG: hypothetical protein M3439_10075 [Chloroflexota bacterium]|nr:hypothetical protein [Chloroflexota bacterium]